MACLIHETPGLTLSAAREWIGKANPNAKPKAHQTFTEDDAEFVQKLQARAEWRQEPSGAGKATA